jgi:hypothetical protein
MSRDADRYETALLERLAKIRQDKLEALGAGVEPDQYKYWTGYIRCIKDVVSVMEDVRKKISRD